MRRLQRINSRLVVLLIITALPLLWYGYVLADQLIYHGIKPHNGWTEVDLRTLGCFPFDADKDGINQVPSRFRALDGQRVVLKGLMNCRYSAGSQINQFELVYNKQVCCFGGFPKVQERVFARCPRGKTVEYAGDQTVRLTGILHVRVVRDSDGIIVAIYEMDVENVDPV